MNGSEYCWSHDPGRTGQRDLILAKMRSRQPRIPMIAWTAVAQQLAPWLAGHKYPAARLADATGVPHSTCSRLLKGRRDSITVDLAQRLLAVVDGPVELPRAA